MPQKGRRLVRSSRKQRERRVVIEGKAVKGVWSDWRVLLRKKAWDRKSAEVGMHNLLIPIGGIIAATGIVSLIFGFEATTGGMMSTTFSEAGYTALDQWTVNATGKMGILMVITGVALMVSGNRTIWRKTGGY